MLASRLKELEDDGLVVREARTGSDRSVVYRATARAEELRTALDALQFRVHGVNLRFSC